ncbi:pigment epithelium-derived factor [Electrophorus electricus]|uniref:Serpin domain-containing protein n=1 Tax=Electrophorus electricus TaxID=8005 RepID=A0A4W4GWR9_ELEEL|nr:pigment epithelium-derived factor [Electrophorus electricus]XP_026875248.2 pigment epithelium-derived factor [Electrophorus electricus]
MKRVAFLLGLWGLFSLCHAQLSDAEEGGDEEVVDLFTTPRSKLAASTSDFGYNLFRQLAARDPKASVLLSPMSISAAFTQLSMGASERAEKQLYRVLRYHSLQDTKIHDTLRGLLASLRASTKGFSSVERLLLARRLRSKPEYLNTVEKQYGERPQILLGGPRDLKTVNDWFRQQTRGKVDRVLATPLPRNSAIVPVGAAYFKGKWITRFGKMGKMEDFQLDGAAPARVAVMQQENYPVKIGMDSDLGCTIAQVPMEDGVSMYFFLPDEVTQNLTLIEEALTSEFVQDLANTLHPVHVQLTLPVLKLVYSTDLLALLSGLGLSEWLEDTDLIKISTQAIKLSTVRHKAVVETAPEGSQYASAPSSSAQQSLALSYRVDRPFLFLVRDEPSGALLFIGKVLNPRDLASA